jgi:hypothetical protein
MKQILQRWPSSWILTKKIHIDEEHGALHSLLLTLQESEPELTYQTEADIRSLVVNAVKDALKLLGHGLHSLFKVRYEVSLFSYRPDIVVVHHSTLGIVLVIKVKKPGASVFASKDVGGQIYDYLMGETSMGVAFPFAVLSTYDEMCIVYRNDDESVRKGCEEIIKLNADNLSSEYVPPDVVMQSIASPTSPNRATSKSKPIIPNTNVRKVLDFITESNHNANEDGKAGDDETSDNDAESDDEEDCSYYPPSVCYSQTFKGKAILPALVLALRCGFDSLATKQHRQLPAHTFSAKGTCAYVNRTSLLWKDIPELIKFDYSKFPGPSTKKYYLWANLGRGSTGRVFLACNTKGKVCAVNIFEKTTPRSQRGAGSRQGEHDGFEEGRRDT